MTPHLSFAPPHLILGGARSGKSIYAEQLIETFPPPYIYLATAQVLDNEMRERVRRHQARRSSRWQTIESPVDLVQTLRSLNGQTQAVLVDCITLWMSNLLLRDSPSPPHRAVEDLCTFLHIVDYPLLLVSNEVGSGIVPEKPLARQYRDLAGWANQQLASACRTVTLVVAGLPLQLKPASSPASVI